MQSQPEAFPATLVNQHLANLPAGVTLAPGRIAIKGFRTVEEAQQKILALIMAARMWASLRSRLEKRTATRMCGSEGGPFLGPQQQAKGSAREHQATPQSLGSWRLRPDQAR
jgi:hypothetical protein